MTAPIDVPADLDLSAGLDTLLAGRDWRLLADSRPTLGWLVTAAGKPDLIVRREQADRPGTLGSIADEVARLQWAAGPVGALGFAVPEVVKYHDGGLDGPSVLVTTPAVGESDLRLMPTQEGPLDALAEALTQLESIDATTCPFAVSPEDLIAHVARRVDAGAIHIGDLHDVYSRSTPERLVEHLRTMAPDPTEVVDPVFVHGALGMHSLRVDPATAQLTGMIDWAWCGIADRHYDLAAASRSVMRVSGVESVGGLFDKLGGPDIKPLRLEFYGLVDELR